MLMSPLVLSNGCPFLFQNGYRGPAVGSGRLGFKAQATLRNVCRKYPDVREKITFGTK